MIPAPAQVRDDFDRIALLPHGPHDHSAIYHRVLLDAVPASCERALDVGCGRGEFTRLLARRSRQVTGIDLSPGMLASARDECRGFANIEFIEADLMTWSAPAGSFDFISSVAMLHHLPFGPAVTALARLLRPGGVLAIIDVRDPGTPWEHALRLPALALSTALRLRHAGRLLPDPRVRAAWADHGSRETYLTSAQARALAGEHLPGSVVRRHLLWRYSLLWRKPS